MGLVQYQPAGNNLTPFTHTALTELSSQYQPAGDSSGIQPPAQYLPAMEGNIPTAIVDARLTHPLSRDDDNDMSAALSRTTSQPHADTLVEGAARGRSARNPRLTNVSVLPAPCVVSSAPTVNHDCNSGATATFIVPSSMLCASMAESVTIMSCTQSSPLFRTLLSKLPASAIASPRLYPYHPLAAASAVLLLPFSGGLAYSCFSVPLGVLSPDHTPSTETCSQTTALPRDSFGTAEQAATGCHKLRSLAELLRRGRWRTEQPLRRCVMPSMLQSALVAVVADDARLGGRKAFRPHPVTKGVSSFAAVYAPPAYPGQHCGIGSCCEQFLSLSRVAVPELQDLMQSFSLI